MLLLQEYKGTNVVSCAAVTPFQLKYKQMKPNVINMIVNKDSIHYNAAGVAQSV
jgi:hypothetical protein